MKPSTLSSYHTVRLTQNEMAQLKLKKNGDVFFHINLQHSGIPYIDFEYEKYLMSTIVKNGLDNGIEKYPPKLNYEGTVLVKLLDITLSIPVKSLYKNDGLPSPSAFLLDNEKGLFESLCDKYTKVRGLTNKQVEDMDAFIRKFEILEFL